MVDLLHEFQRQKNHLAIILDEFGGTTGLVSFEDVLEEIVGEIEDEHDAPKQAEIQAKPDGTFDISGRAYLEDINDQLGLSIVSEEVDTIGGYLTHLAGHVPKAEESFTIHSMRFVVKQANTRQVRRILAEKSPALLKPCHTHEYNSAPGCEKQFALTFTLLGAVGCFLGFANPVVHVPAAILLFPLSLFVLALRAPTAPAAFRRGCVLGFGICPLPVLAGVSHLPGGGLPCPRALRFACGKLPGPVHGPNSPVPAPPARAHLLWACGAGNRLWPAVCRV